MAAGDAQRVWFREMVERLRDQWHPDMPFDAIISLREDLDAMLQRIRSEGNIGSRREQRRPLPHPRPPGSGCNKRAADGRRQLAIRSEEVKRVTPGSSGPPRPARNT